MKRSSSASGSGYVPSNSTGFWVANTVNTGDSAWLVPSIVTVRSCIASSSAAWVLAGARLISSASTRSAKMGRSEEHTSELQSQSNLVCRLLLEKKKQQQIQRSHA